MTRKRPPTFIMRRLTIAFCLLAQAYAQQEPVGKKIADPGAAAKSGLLAVSSIEEGLFLVKRSGEPKRRLRGVHP